MIRSARPGISSMMILACLSLGLAGAARGQEVWSGHTVYFEKASYADWTLPENQDRITPAVWISRKNTQGIFNIAQEDGYSAISPMDTEWATGSAAEWQNLTFSTWVIWTGGNPAGTIGLDAVVHLISDGIYIDIRFESFVGGNAGGGFSYYRGDDPIPVEPAALSMIKKLF